MNFEKTLAVWLGVYKNRVYGICPEINLMWVKEFTMLGIKFSINLPEMIDLNYDKKIYDIDKVLTVYKNFKLSIILGK